MNAFKDMKIEDLVSGKHLKKGGTMKKIALALIFITFIIPKDVLASEIKALFRGNIETSVDNVIESWIKEDEKEMRESLVTLARYEKNMLAVKDEEEEFEYSYLAHIPKGLNIKGLAAFLYLLREKREGVNLFPISFFEGRSFSFKEEVQK